MSVKIKKEKFINIIGSIDIEKKTGEILYVTPTKVGIQGTGSSDGRVLLVVEDDVGEELSRAKPCVRYDACRNDSKDGLIQHDISYLEGMKVLRLLIDNEEVARYEAGASSDSATGGMGGMGGTAAPAQTKLTDLGSIEGERGVSYTVMCLPEEEGSWTALCTGMEKPKFKFDHNQFPNSKKVLVRVIRSTGFEDEIITEETVKLHK